MMLFNRSKLFRGLILVCIMFIGPTSFATDADDLTAMLHAFLAGAGEAAVHERFWAEELVYTASNGSRTSKAQIMQGFNASDRKESEEPGPVYTGEDIRVMLYGTTAVVAFRLVATPANDAEDSAVQSYFNTGTFLKRNGVWQAVAWQATRIPAP